MSIYIVQIIIVIITLSVGIFLLKIADTQKKVRRISRFSLDIPKENTSLLTKIEDGLVGDITDELNKILKDLKHNISLEDAYLKFYNRSKIKEVLAIYQNLKIASLLNISYLNAYKYIINENIKTYEEKENTFKIIDIYNYLFLIVLMIPLLVFIFGLFINLDYFAKLMSGKGLYLVVGVIIIYSIYI